MGVRTEVRLRRSVAALSIAARTCVAAADRGLDASTTREHDRNHEQEFVRHAASYSNHNASRRRSQASGIAGASRRADDTGVDTQLSERAADTRRANRKDRLMKKTLISIVMLTGHAHGEPERDAQRHRQDLESLDRNLPKVAPLPGR